MRGRPVLNTRESLLSRQLRKSPNPRALPEEVLAAVVEALPAFAGRPEGGKSYEVIVVEDNPYEPMVGCFVYEDDLEEGVFVATVSAALVSLLYSLGTVIEESAAAGAASDCYEIHHPPTRRFAEAVELLCRDNREPIPLLRRIFAPPDRKAGRWPALEELSFRIAQRQSQNSECVAINAPAIHRLYMSIAAIAEHELVHATRRHLEIRSKACAEDGHRLSPAGYTWCAEYEADVYSQAWIFEKSGPLIADQLFREINIENSDEQKIFRWLGANEISMLVFALIYVEQLLAREEERSRHLSATRDSFLDQQAAFLLQDDYPPVSFRQRVVHDGLFRQIHPDASELVAKLARRLFRHFVDQRFSACADWLGDVSLLALGAATFDDLDSFEVNERFLLHNQPAFYELRAELPPPQAYMEHS